MKFGILLIETGVFCLRETGLEEPEKELIKKL